MKLYHYTLGYKVEGDTRIRLFYTYAEDETQAVQDLFDNVADVSHGNILTKLNVPTGTRRPLWQT